MKFATLPCLFAAVCSAHGLANAIRDPAPVIKIAPAPTQAPELVDDAAQPHLEPRQGAAVANPVASLNPSQYPIATTQWLESTILGTTTYVSIAYTQTFAAVPDQLQTAGKGTIGLGTLTKHKRDVEAVETGNIEQTLVLELHQEVVTQYVQPVMEILVLHTILVLPNSTNNTFGNFTYPGFNGTLFNITTNSTGNTTALPIITSTVTALSAADYNRSTGSAESGGSSSIFS
ncbi:hypothetical protein LTR97_006607 [Elasticomyces elasticus]|uniref:Uncharacterized protein n=1 Tax=Elasticomyces elasticus TaxID=574655 RepID=A0AAN7W6K1_9PEZI|nr:hypothetical protein LTR97_006607 [Elasticomyces elasticus]